MTLIRLPLLLLILAPIASVVHGQTHPFRNPDLSVEERARDLVRRLTTAEKIAQLNYDAPAVERLGMPAYNWWNEALHGVARNGRATVFPQAIGLAATWDEELILRVGGAISEEARAKFNASQRIGNLGRYAGLTFWSPNVNIYRDPRWGRGQETYGEDPFLAGRIGVAFVRGLQGDHPRYLKAAASAKHYAVHSGPEGDRHHFNAVPPLKDFQETYLPAFRALVTEGKVEIVMCAYNRLYDEVACGSNLLLQEILRGQWGFEGHVVSDCWALVDFHTTHNVTERPEESAALAFRTGVNVDCGNTSPFLEGALREGLIAEAEIDEALVTLLQTRFRLGLFDPPDMVPFNRIGPEVINSHGHRELAREAARKAVVLLKNDGALPLAGDIRRLHVLGPNAADGNVLLGNYFGISPNLHTILEGIAGRVDAGTHVEYNHAFLLDRENINPIDWTTGAAHEADAIVVVMGLSGLLEGEEGESLASPTKSDRFDIRLPENQVDYLRRLRGQGETPIVAVVTGGSPIAMPEVHELADAVLYVWYPGEEGGRAVADVLFGDASPSGRLPITFPKAVDQLPPYDDYSMVGRTYRYMTEEPLYPFGFGLSYTTFEYGGLRVSQGTVTASESVEVRVDVTNRGSVAAEEVVQCYLSNLDAPVRVPLHELRGFQRVRLWPGETRTVVFTLSPDSRRVVDEEGAWLPGTGEFRVTVGGASPGRRAVDLGAPEPVSATFTVTAD
jgi:beta-glucosidase